MLIVDPLAQIRPVLYHLPSSPCILMERCQVYWEHTCLRYSTAWGQSSMDGGANWAWPLRFTCESTFLGMCWARSAALSPKMPRRYSQYLHTRAPNSTWRRWTLHLRDCWKESSCLLYESCTLYWTELCNCCILNTLYLTKTLKSPGLTVRWSNLGRLLLWACTVAN